MEKRQEAATLRGKSLGELEAELKKLRSEFTDLKMKLKTGALKDKSAVVKHKKRIARFLTVVREKQIIGGTNG